MVKEIQPSILLVTYVKISISDNPKLASYATVIGTDCCCNICIS